MNPASLLLNTQTAAGLGTVVDWATRFEAWTRHPPVTSHEVWGFVVVLVMLHLWRGAASE